MRIYNEYPYGSRWQFSGDRLTIVPGSCQFMDTKEYLTKEQETTHLADGATESSTHFLPRITGPSDQNDRYEWHVGEANDTRPWSFCATRERAHEDWYWIDGGGDDGVIRG